MPAVPLRPASPPDLVEQVYQALLEAISDGTLPPGKRLTQEDLASWLAVSRQPVTLALRRLKQDGLVQAAPLAHGAAGRTRGLQVSPLDPEQVARVHQVRSALDALAVQLAAQRRADMDPALFIRGRASVARGDVRAMIAADLDYHRALYQASGNPLIEQSALLHWHHIRRAMALVLRTHPLRASVWDEHAAIAAAIAAGDATHAEALMREHGQQARERLFNRLATLTPTSTPPDDGRSSSPQEAAGQSPAAPANQARTLSKT